MNLFKDVFLEKSRQDLILISRAFFELYKKSLYDSIESETSGRNSKLLKGILFGVITPAQWFAKKAFKSIEGLGTDEKTLNRVLVSRAEVDMDAIREFYFRDRKTDIKSDIHGDTSGTYRKILINPICELSMSNYFIPLFIIIRRINNDVFIRRIEQIIHI